MVCVQAHAPQDYYLLKIVEIKAPLHNAVLSIEQDGALISLSQGAAAKFASWQRDTEVLVALDEPYAYGASGRDHLLALRRGVPCPFDSPGRYVQDAG